MPLRGELLSLEGLEERAKTLAAPREDPLHDRCREPERRCRGVASVELDGSLTDPAAIPLADDGRDHRLRVVLGAGRVPK